MLVQQPTLSQLTALIERQSPGERVGDRRRVCLAATEGSASFGRG